MGKSTKKKNKKITAPKANIQELSISRDGGQIALRGYSYQFLYSCYLILSSSNPSNFFQLEGIEDIDCIMQKNGSNDITHIQLKYSVNKQDASFLTDVLKNFLEAYLLDQNRFFKLVYDFPVAKGHLSKIFASKLDEKSRTHWAGVISNIKKNNPSWNWSVYDFDKFISHLSFEKIEKSILATEIEKTLIRIYEINTDNVSLFANSIKILCFEKMEQRAYVTKAELDSKIQSVKIDISKGPQNPAHSWIRKLDYSKPSIDEGCSFYEGKKATPADIVSGFPIKRPSLEKDVINSICENMVTVIKASSGQGKTTLALRAAYILQNEYIPYQLLWCDEIKHVVKRLHEFLPIDNTAISVMKMADKADLSILFSHLPEFTLNKETFFRDAVESLWDEKDLSNYTSAIQGLFSGSVMQYFLSNRAAFDDADAHGGLFLLSTEMCPFAVFEDFGVSMDTLDKMRESFPDNKNIEYLCRLRERIPTCCLQETYVYIFCDCLYRKMRTFRFDGIKDITSYTSISEWIYNINPEWNVSAGFSLDDLWSKPEKLTLECVSTLMYLSYCGNREKYMEFVERNLKSILTYLKQWTRSHRVFIDSEKKAIHIEYILRLHNIKTGNEQSVSRLKFLCKALPIFDLYCADALKPTVDLLSAYPVPDDAHKEMPIKNIVIMFHQNLTSLWNKTIMSNYEFDTATEWLNYWFDVREHICLLADKCCACIYKLLGGKPLGSLAGEVDQLREEFALITTGEKRYPKEDRPFEEKATVPERLGKIKSKYFQSIQNFMNQFAGFLIKNEQKQRLAMVNLTIAQSALVTMQNYFAEIAIDFSFQERQLTLCVMETQNIERLIMCCSYYQTHSPNKYFNKYQISNWYDGHCRDERKIVEDGLSELESKYSIHFPDQIYTIDMLSYYPIIVGNFDMASESNLTEWLLGCIAFADAPFDYLVILSANESKEIDSTALQFPRRMLVDVKKAIESENHSLLDKLVPPYPVNVTAQMLDCFSEKYDLPEKKVTDVDELPIGYIAEELWIYSKSVELLTEPEDACYLAAQTQDIQLNITEMLCLLKNKLPVKDVDWLIEICDNVFSGEKFDDIMFNNVIEHFIQKKIEQ